MWKLVIEQRDRNTGAVIGTTILYVSENAFINQPIFAAKSAPEFIQAEAERQEELAKFYLPLLITNFHKNSFPDVGKPPQHKVAIFYVEVLIIADPAKLWFTLSYFEGHTQERKTGNLALKSLYEQLGSDHLDASANMSPLVRMTQEDTKQALELYAPPTEKQNIQWLNCLTQESQHFLPEGERFIEYLPINFSFDNASSKDIEDYVKYNVIIALYNAALAYYREIWKETIAENKIAEFNKKRNSFNFKFKGIAQIQDNGSLSTLATALEESTNHSLLHFQDNANLEYLVDQLLLRCARQDEWLRDGGRAYFAVLNHLNLMESALCVDGLLNNIKPSKHFFNILLLEGLPTGFRGISILAYKNFIEPFLRKIGVMGPRFRFAFTSFAKKICDNRDQAVAVRITDAAALAQLANGSVREDYDGDNYLAQGHSGEEHPPRLQTVSRYAALHEQRRRKRENINVEEVANASAPPRKKRFTMANFRKFMEKVYKFMASDAFTRIMIGVGIGAGIAIVAAVIVTIIFFSGGTIIPVAAAAAGVAAMGGVGGMIATMLSGLLTFSSLGGVFGWLAHKKIEKNKAEKIIAVSTGVDYVPYHGEGAHNSSDMYSGMGITPGLTSQNTGMEIVEDGDDRRKLPDSQYSSGKEEILLSDDDETSAYLQAAFDRLDQLEEQEDTRITLNASY